jgi:predicted phosphodiesterase
MTSLVFIGDPHGEFAKINRFLLAHRSPGTAVLLGDFDLERPFREVFAQAIAVGWNLRWILGNHDADNEVFYRNLVDDFPSGEIAGPPIEINGIRIAGLGGVIRSKIWNGIDPPLHQSPDDMMRALGHQHRWRKGLPLRQRATIFKSAVDELACHRADILVCHEAPSTHLFGCRFLDELADAMRVRLIFHGHHHRSYETDLTLPSGRTCQVRGLGIAECWQTGDL